MPTAETLLVSFALIFIIGTIIADIKKSRLKLKERILNSWGKEPHEKYRHEDLESIASCFMNSKSRQPSRFAIDDITCSDLDLNDVFIRLNNTQTTAGEETLYRLLREPSFDIGVLQARGKLIEFFLKHRGDREKIQLILSKLGKKRLSDISNYFYRAPSSSSRKLWVYRLLSVTALLSPLILFLNTGLGVLLIILSLTTNMFVYYGRRIDLSADLAAIGYIIRLVQTVGRLINKGMTAPELSEYRSRLQQRYGKIKKVGRRGVFLLFVGSGSIADLIFEYVKICLLKELIDYESLCRDFRKHRDDLIQVYEDVGLLDSFISIASFRKSVTFYCEPVLEAPGSLSGKRLLQFDDLYHPLINNPIYNSLTTDRCVLITGSNASGKSTFLKTVAINAILAQSFYTCLARSYTAPVFAVFTSMALRDSMKDGESYFVAEIRSIKRILDRADSDVSCLCLIDEVLRGTNTVERIAASSEVLLQLARQNCVCIAATHDVELTFILESCYRNMHFQETITDESICFDYRLREGRATSRNAIKLLQLMGYSPEIVRQAEMRADGFMSQGGWAEAPPFQAG